MCPQYLQQLSFLCLIHVDCSVSIGQARSAEFLQSVLAVNETLLAATGAAPPDYYSEHIQHSQQQRQSTPLETMNGTGAYAQHRVPTARSARRVSPIKLHDSHAVSHSASERHAQHSTAAMNGRAQTQDDDDDDHQHDAPLEGASLHGSSELKYVTAADRKYSTDPPRLHETPGVTEHYESAQSSRHREPDAVAASSK